MAVQLLTNEYQPHGNFLSCKDISLTGVEKNPIKEYTQILPTVVIDEINLNSFIIKTANIFPINPFDKFEFDVNFTGLNILQNDFLVANIMNYTGTYGTNGLPHLSLKHTSTHNIFTICIFNLHSTNQIHGSFDIGFELINPLL